MTTAYDPFDDPVDLDAAPDWDAPAPAVPEQQLPPEPTWTPPPVDDDEAAFWRDQRAEADAERAPHRRVDRASYNEWMASERRVAYTVPCPTCKVGVGAPCVRVDYRGQPTTDPIRRYPAHDPRIRLARRKLTAR